MIRADALVLDIEGNRILDGVSFEVERGQSVALVGPNGSGKTTVLRCLLGLVPFAGTALIGGHDVLRDPVAARSLVGYVPQKAAFGDARADEVLRFIARLRGLEDGRIAEVLSETHLEAHAQARVRTFSGGMMQRLAIATALLADPPVLLLDEPSANLDEEGQRTFAALVDRLRERGRTLVLASHRGEEVDALTDRTIRLDGGRVRPGPAVVPGRPLRLVGCGARGAE
jgi:ABC-type multidrug transport system ATPase subunit